MTQIWRCKGWGQARDQIFRKSPEVHGIGLRTLDEPVLGFSRLWGSRSLDVSSSSESVQVKKRIGELLVRIGLFKLGGRVDGFELMGSYLCIMHG